MAKWCLIDINLLKILQSNKKIVNSVIHAQT